MTESQFRPPPGALSPPPVMCQLCRRPLTTLTRAYQRVTGWEQKRKAGGTNALRGRRTFHEWAHAECVDRLAAGNSPDQEQMF